MKFRIPASIHLTPEQQTEARRGINLAIFGHENCNVEDAGGQFRSHPDLTPEVEARLLEAHKGVSSSHEVTIEVTIDPMTGKWSYQLPPKHVQD